MEVYADKVSQIALIVFVPVALLYFYGVMAANFFAGLRKTFLWLFGARIATAREWRGESWAQAVLRPVSEQGPLTSGFIPSLAYVLLWAMIFFASFRFVFFGL